MADERDHPIGFIGMMDDGIEELLYDAGYRHGPGWRNLEAAVTRPEAPAILRYEPSRRREVNLAIELGRLREWLVGEQAEDSVRVPEGHLARMLACLAALSASPDAIIVRAGLDPTTLRGLREALPVGEVLEIA